MRIERFSEKQRKVLRWWVDEEERQRYDCVICDGAVRSGKTLAASLSFLFWAMSCFSDGDFAICGKTVGACRRNVIMPLRKAAGGIYKFAFSGNMMVVKSGGKVNRFHLFGGKDEGSAALIQGMTLWGVYLDEAAVMPQSFVEQAMARCSKEGAKVWMSLNPEGPEHWLYKEWILKEKEKRVLRLQFQMEDNPSLSEAVRERYRTIYSGLFYRRYVMGEWTAGEGLVYPMFSQEHLFDKPPKCEQYYISIDYGTMNPFSAGLWGVRDGVFYRIREYYHSGRDAGMKTDEEYYRAVERLAGRYPVKQIIIDPSAASFIACIKKHGRFSVRKAKNQVLPGIRRTGGLLAEGKIRIARSCEAIIGEFSRYVWEAGGADRPVKEHDHAMDEMRYLIETVSEKTMEFT